MVVGNLSGLESSGYQLNAEDDMLDVHIQTSLWYYMFWLGHMHSVQLLAKPETMTAPLLLSTLLDHGTERLMHKAADLTLSTLLGHDTHIKQRT